MGFGFNLFAVFILFPLTGALLLIWLVTGKRIFGKIILFIGAGVFGLYIFSTISQYVMAKTILSKDDYYGQYIIDRNYFRGKQADWQYNKYRFEIKSNDSVFFYVTDQEKILHIFKGIISTEKAYRSEVLVLHMQQPTHPVMSGDPEINRSAWSFYLVFNSPKYGNMFFRKGKWKQLGK